MIHDARKLQLYRSSIPLCRLDIHGVPTSNASGALVNYKGKRILLTVEHATGDFGNWAMQLEYQEGRGTNLYRLGAMNFLKCYTLQSGKIKTIDFAYTEVPINILPIKQKIDDSLIVVDSIPTTVLDLEFPCKPKKGVQYGFSGLIKTSLEQHVHALVFASEYQIYDNLEYVETRDNDVLVFKMPRDHPGHEEFEGCSGSPIIDSEGRVVGLLTSGCESKNEIYGLALDNYRAILEMYGEGII